ncbi:hypothetical protein D3C75_1153750 [compost metagenome]
MTGNGDDCGLLPGARIHHQHLVSADGGHKGLMVGDGPALQVRHLVDGQFRLAASVIGEHSLYPALGMP